MTRLRKASTPTLWIPLAVVSGWVLVALLTGALGSQASTESPERLLPVSTITAQLAESYPVQRSFVGRVEARRESDVGFELGGLVAHIHVDDGASVSAGQLLASLDTELLQARRAELVSARDRARADLDLAIKTRKRINELQALDFASSQARDEAVEGVNAKRAALEMAESAIRSIDVQIRKSQLRAPYDALVAARHVDEGQVIPVGVPVLRLFENSEPEARIAIAVTEQPRFVQPRLHPVRQNDTAWPCEHCPLLSPAPSPPPLQPKPTSAMTANATEMRDLLSMRPGLVDRWMRVEVGIRVPSRS